MAGLHADRHRLLRRALQYLKQRRIVIEKDRPDEAVHVVELVHFERNKNEIKVKLFTNKKVQRG